MNYYPAAHQRSAYRDLNLPGSGSLPVTEQISREILSLPIDPLLTEDDIDYVCDSLIEALHARSAVRLKPTPLS
jgi:dTDP-4-amino-4,6-dideoxygalactose transaminase